MDSRNNTLGSHMTRLRNMIADNWNYLGAYDVGILAENCTGVLTRFTTDYPNSLLRPEIYPADPTVDMSEDGTVNAGTGFTWRLYVDGELTQAGINYPPVSSYQPGRRRHRSGSGGIGAVSGGSGHGVVS